MALKRELHQDLRGVLWNPGRWAPLEGLIQQGWGDQLGNMHSEPVPRLLTRLARARHSVGVPLPLCHEDQWKPPKVQVLTPAPL